MVDIWYKFLSAARGDKEAALAALTPSQLAEGHEMLTRVLETRAKLLGAGHIATGESKYTLGLLHTLRGDKQGGIECVSFASEIYTKHLGPEHPSTRDTLACLQELNMSPDV